MTVLAKPPVLRLFLILLFVLAIGIPTSLATDEGYGEDEQALGQFVDTYEDLDNVTVIDDLVRNSTLNYIELNSTTYTEYIQDPVQWREHDRYAGFDPNHWWTLSTADFRQYTSNLPRGDGYMFINVDAQWLEGKYIRIRWFTVSAENNRPMYFQVYDGSYNRSSMTDFPEHNAILTKGAGLLYSYREPTFNAWVTRDFLMDLDTWGHTLDTVMIGIKLRSNTDWYVRAYWDWIEFNDGAGGADNLFNITFNTDLGHNKVDEQLGTFFDYGYVNNTGLPYVGGGYDEDGYFITTDSLDYTSGAGLALLTNTSISLDADMTVQFSQDNSTWLDNHGNVGSTTIEDGFFSIDLRDLNYTDIYSMYNFSGTLTDSPILYQSRIISTIGAGAGPCPPGPVQNVTGVWESYNVTQINATVGTVDNGNATSTLDLNDGDTFNVSEVVGVPGIDISFNGTGVDPSAGCLWVVINALYDGNLAHDFDIQLWNYTGLSWTTLDHITDGVGFSWFNVSIYDLRAPNDFIDGSGNFRGRLYHTSAGNINHDLYIDYLKIHAFTPNGGAPTVTTVTTTTDTTPFIAIGIILALSMILIGFKVRNR